MNKKRFTVIMLICAFLMNVVSCSEPISNILSETTASTSLMKEVTTQKKTTQEKTSKETTTELATTTTTELHTTLPETTLATTKKTASTTKKITSTTKTTTKQSTTKITTKISTTKTTKSESKSRTYYWVPNGKVYHTTSSCATLKRSKTIRSGTLSQAKAAGKSRVCKVCS